jgi:hypothetical protein
MIIFKKLNARYNRGWVIDILCQYNYFTAKLIIFDESGLPDEYKFEAKSMPKLLEKIERFVNKKS